jgi:CBS domain containing-hemolysin-like protein
MMTLLVVILISLICSFCCSMMEAALLTVPYAHVKHVAEQGSRAGKKLLAFKDDIRQPIAAVLLLNTVANSIGSALGGALVVQTFHTDSAVVIYSILFTLLILYGAEIPPKELGVVYSRSVSLFMTYPLSLLIKIFYPLIRLSEFVAKLVGTEEDEPSMSLAEVLSVAKIGSEEGVLDRLEGSVIRNIIGLDRRLVKDVLTPRVVVFRLDEETVVTDVREDILTWNHTRIPLFPEDEPDRIERYVLQRDVFRALVRGQDDVRLRDLGRPLTTVSSLMRADKLLLEMFEKREHICAVVDEHGGFAGIVTLEDIIEEIVGREIVDESDLVSDLRSYARSIYARRNKK